MRRAAAGIALVAVAVIVPAPAPDLPDGLTSRAADPHGGPDWALRVWDERRSPYGGTEPTTCLQAGQVVDGRLVRRLGPGRERALGRQDRTICGAPDAGGSYDGHPVTVERVADDPRRPRRFTHTIVAGLTPQGMRPTLEVRGRPRPVRASRRGAFLAVLDGDTRLRDLRVAFARPGLRGPIDFGTGRVTGLRPYDLLVPASVRTPLTVPDPSGTTRRIAAVRYRVGREACVEPASVVAGEPGVWSPTWGTFLDAPTLADPERFTRGDWRPVAAPPANALTSGCTDSDPGFADPRRPAAMLVRRLTPGVVAVAGLLRPGEQAVRLRRPDGRSVRVAARGGAFLAAMRSTGRVGESFTVRIVGRDGRPVVQRIATGPQDRPTAFETFVPRERGRVIRIGWLGGELPFVGVDAARVGGRVVLRPVERGGPSFLDDGSYILQNAIGIPKCADVVLPRALVGLPVRAPRQRKDFEDVPAAVRARFLRRERDDLRDDRCVRVQAGERLLLTPGGADAAALTPR